VLLPDTFGQQLGRLNSLNSDDFDRFSIALTWLEHSGSIWPWSRSASFTALTSAVEALLPDDEQKCRECGQAIYKISQRFRDFLSKYAPNEGPAETLKKLQVAFCSTRSGITHGSSLLQADLEPWKFLDYSGTEEQLRHSKLYENGQSFALQLARELLSLEFG
jgi:hypothetical protein